MTNLHKTKRPKRKTKRNGIHLLPRPQAFDRLSFTLMHVESICREDPRVFSVQLPTQHGDVAHWVNAHICYSGVEQAMKMFLPTSQWYDDPHNLCELYQILTETAKCKDKDAYEASKAAKIAVENIRSYYRVYYSFHRFQDRPKEKTAEDFLLNIGDKYTNWRYTLREDWDHPSMVHARFMLEIWRSLLRSGNSPWCRRPQTARIDDRIRHYFQSMFRDAEQKVYILTMNRDETPDFECINKWVDDMGGVLMAGLHVFRHLQRDEKHLVKAEGDTKECVIKSAQGYRQKIQEKVLPEGIFDMMPDQPERCDEIYRMHFMCLDGLRWNAESDVFEIEEEYTSPPAD